MPRDEINITKITGRTGPEAELLFREGLDLLIQLVEEIKRERAHAQHDKNHPDGRHPGSREPRKAG